jgi:hypothetical protein
MKCALLVVILAAIALAGCGSQAPRHTTTPPVAAPAPALTAKSSNTTLARSSPATTTASSPVISSSASRGSRPHAPRPYTARVTWQAAAVASARAFVGWFDRWLAGESSARRAPEVTAAYAAKLRASVNNVPPAAKGHVAAMLYLIPVAMPPGAAHPHEVSVYTVTRSQGTVIRFTIRERLYGHRWLVYGLDQGA